MSSLKHNTREAWLRSAAKLLAPLFQSVDATLPPELQFSAAPISQGAIGTCHDKQHSSDEKTRNGMLSEYLGGGGGRMVTNKGDAP